MLRMEGPRATVEAVEARWAVSTALTVFGRRVLLAVVASFDELLLSSVGPRLEESSLRWRLGE